MHPTRSSARTARSRLAIAAGRIAGWASQVTGRGAGQQISGRVMLAVEPDLLHRLAAGKRVIVVSATNGKTTTTRMLTAILEAQGEPVTSNSTGANLASGAANALARATPGSFCVLEIDERALVRVHDAIRPELVVLGNLSRDQLDRYGEVHTLAGAWRRMLAADPDQVVVANSSDPSIVWAASPATTTWVALPPGWTDDAATCPTCGVLLAFDGPRFTCPQCGWTNPPADTRLEDDTIAFAHGQRLSLQLALPGRWNLDNAALAVAAAAQLGVRPAHAVAAVATVGSVSGRYATYALTDGRPARILLAKNPAGWSEVLDYLAGTDAGVVLTVNAHIADGKDPSWLWDVPYERLRGTTVAVAGERALDVAVRLRHADVPCTVFEDPLEAASRIPGRTVEIVASYTQFHTLTRRLRRHRITEVSP